MQLKIVSFFLTLNIICCSADYNKLQMRQFLQATKLCYEKLSIPTDSTMMERVIYNKDLEYDVLEKEYIACLHQKLGWADMDGNFKAQALIDFFANNYSTEQVTELTEKCIQSNRGETPRDKSYELYQCYWINKRFQI